MKQLLFCGLFLLIAASASADLVCSSAVMNACSGGGGGGITGSFTATRVPFASGASALTDDSDMTFATDTLTVTKLIVPTLADLGRITSKSTGSGTPVHFEVPALTTLTGADNICIGTASCAAATTANQNVVIGSNAGDGATTGMTTSVLIGYNAGTGSNIGAANVAVGSAALDATTGTSAGSNTAVGANALGGVTSSASNTGIGASACVSVTTGSFNTCIGAGSNAAAALTTTIALGNSATATASNQMVVGANGLQITDVYWSEGVTNASPVDVTHNATGGSGTDIAGAGYYTAGGKGTGSGAPGEWVAQTSAPGSTGTTLQTLASRMWIEGSQKTLTAAAATAVVRIAVPQGTVTGGVFEYVVHADDGTEYQARSGRLNWQAVNKAGTETCVVGDGSAIETEDGSSLAASSSTLTYAVTCTSNAADTVDLEINAVSGLTETTLRVEQWILHKNGGAGAVTPQ